MAHRIIKSPEHLENWELFETLLKIAQNCIFLILQILV